LANNALAIRIIFPSVRVIQVSFNLTGLPASLGKQKNQPKAGSLYLAEREGFYPNQYITDIKRKINFKNFKCTNQCTYDEISMS